MKLTGKTSFSSDIRNFINHITYYIYSLIFFIAYTFKGQGHVLAGQAKIVSHSSCRTSEIFLSPEKLSQYCLSDIVVIGS